MPTVLAVPRTTYLILIIKVQTTVGRLVIISQPRRFPEAHFQPIFLVKNSFWKDFVRFAVSFLLMWLCAMALRMSIYCRGLDETNATPSD